MPTLRLFASAREAAGVARVDLEGATVADVLAEARSRYGERFASVLATSRVWVNGQPADDATPLSGFDVVAVLPPVSGGAATPEAPRQSRAAARPGRDGGGVGVTRPPQSVSRRERPPRVPSPERTVDAPFLRLVPPPAPDLAPSPRRLRHPAAPTPPAGPALARAVPDAVPQPVLRSTEPSADGSVAATPKPGPPLAVVPKSSRPHGRLGLAWAVLVTAAVALGPGWLAALLAVAAFVAASQTATVWVRRSERPLPAFAAATAAALPVAAMSGVAAMNVVVVVALSATLAARLAWPTKAPCRDVALTVVIGLAVGLAAASPVLLREINVQAPLFLLAIAAAYDAGAYLVGTGASSAWEGPAAGIAAVIPLTMFAGLMLVPPFGGGAPLLLGALGALLAPIGPVAGSALLGDATANAPGLRRLDSLLVLGPVWAWCAAGLLL
jgi:sulfur-carrier protein